MEKTLRRKLIFKGRILTLYQHQVLLDNGHKSSREVILHPGAVAIIPLLTPKKIVMIRQFRKALEKVIYEIPAGTLEPKEKIAACAQRELGEEIGYRARQMKKLLSFYPAPGYTNEVIHIFVGRGLTPVPRQLEEDEQIEPVVLSVNEVKKLIRQGKIQDSKTLIGISAWLGLLR